LKGKEEKRNGAGVGGTVVEPKKGRGLKKDQLKERIGNRAGRWGGNRLEKPPLPDPYESSKKNKL